MYEENPGQPCPYPDCGSSDFPNLLYFPETGVLYRTDFKRETGTLCRNTGYLLLSYNNKTYLAHRLSFYLYFGFWPKQVDHINRNRADNRIENLREVETFEQATNKAGWSSGS